MVADKAPSKTSQIPHVASDSMVGTRRALWDGMRATRIEVRTAALQAGVAGVTGWRPAGQLIATLWLEQPDDELARQVAASITRLGSEEVAATVGERKEIG